MLEDDRDVPAPHHTAPVAVQPDDAGDGTEAWPDGAGGGDDPTEEARDRRARTVRAVVDLLVVGACVLFTLWHLQPDLLVEDTIPAGGDMGAHVWGPAYLRDHLLPQGQVAGWSDAWYAGFPAYQFYMVVPALLIVYVNAGAQGWAALGPAAVAVAATAVAVRGRRRPAVRWGGVAAAVVALGFAGLPYGVAFKLVSVSGVLTLPVAAYAFGRLAGARFPTPAVLAVFTLPYLFYRGYSIYGGNIASTLAGEFSFAMSLSLALVYAGVVLRGLATGRHRALAAVLLALTGLCHIIPAFWAIGATSLAVVVRSRPSATGARAGIPVALVGAGALTAGAALAGAVTGPGRAIGLVVAGLGLATLAVGLWLTSESVRWLTPTAVVGGLLSMWWVAPFYLRADYVNDMGWEKLPYADPEMSRFDEWRQHLMPYATPDVDLRWVFALALLGTGLAAARRLRVGIFLALATLGAGVAFVVLPEGRLWNGRLLPFYYLTTMLLAGLAVSELVRTVSDLVRGPRRAPVTAGVPVALGALAVILVVVGVPLGQLPYTRAIEGGYQWPRFSPWRVTATPASFVPSWARWNFSGYELKETYREYRDVVTTMAELGEQRGCGRAFWEYDKELLDSYGTPMSLMLLPHWTDGCIRSMEGLYFEASATTPFHFLVQVELSTNPSAAQRDLPYGHFDIAKGVDHLQMMGVRYYMATSDNAVAQARSHPDLTEVASSGPWVIFEVADSPLVEPLANEPAVVEGLDGSHADWVELPHDEDGRFGGPAIRWFNEPERWDVPIAESGPEGWQRVGRDEVPEVRPLEEVEVRDVVFEDERIRFEVDQVGVPVLVKVSYFPNWRATGAEGPWRVAPNFMVVVPTDTEVELTYGRTPVEYLAYALTLAGVVGLVLLARRPPYRFGPSPWAPGGEDDEVGPAAEEPAGPEAGEHGDDPGRWGAEGDPWEPDEDDPAADPAWRPG